MNLSQPAAPHLLIDKERCMLNIERMSGKAFARSVSFRPHFKTHQSAEVGNWFRESGVKKITVSSLRMAYYFAGHGWQDILVGIAYNPGEHKLYEQLAHNCRLSITIASAQAAKILASRCTTPLDVMIKLDTGYNRSGIIWDDDKELLKA
ncbi:MAG TPA: alanine racemase, partial [Bacteroidales bacterium]|nr:alanine racemase [Bacteroidales bacterium]